MQKVTLKVQYPSITKTLNKMVIEGTPPQHKKSYI